MRGLLASEQIRSWGQHRSHIGAVLACRGLRLRQEPSARLLLDSNSNPGTLETDHFLVLKENDVPGQ